MKKYILTTLFLIIIFTPVIFDLLGLRISKGTSENRALQAKPEFSLSSTLSAGDAMSKCLGLYKDITRYKNDYDGYYKDNFIFKPVLFRPYNFIKQHILKTNSIPQKVVSGTDGWMFLGDSYSNVIMESKGYSVFSEGELSKVENNLVEQKKWLDDRNIKFYVAVAPNKLSVYGEYLPVLKSENSTKLQQLKAKLAETNIEFIDLAELFDTHKCPYLYFFKTNTHWNDIGAFYGYKAMISKIRSDFPIVKPLEFEDLQVSDYLSYQEDLTKMLDIHVKEENVKLTVKNRTADQVANILVVPKTVFLQSSDYEMRFKSPVNNLKILVFRDSFGTAMMQFFAENFGESLFIWSHQFDKDLIIKEKPDIVIHEIIERDIEMLMD